MVVHTKVSLEDIQILEISYKESLLMKNLKMNSMMSSMTKMNLRMKMS